MPALSLPESDAAALTHALFPLAPGVVSALEEEDFLLLHSCVVSASRKKRRRVNARGVCYSVTYEDFEMSYRCTAEVTAGWGLSNYHPGRKLNEAALPWFANGEGGQFGVKGGVLIYEDPTVTRLPADLPGLVFTVARENAEMDEAQLVVPAVEDVTSRSWPVVVPPGAGEGAQYGLIYDAAAIWRRSYVLTSPETSETYTDYHLLLGPGSYEAVPLADTWHRLPRSRPVPYAMAALLALPEVAPGDVSGVTVVEEAVAFPPSAAPLVLRAGSGDILPHLATGAPLPVDGLPAGTLWLYEWHEVGAETPTYLSASTRSREGVTTLAGHEPLTGPGEYVPSDTFPFDPVWSSRIPKVLVAVFDLPTGQWVSF